MEQFIGIFSESFWYVAPLLMTITVALSGVINQGFKINGAIWRQLISWVVGSGLSVGAYFLKLVTMGDPQWLGVVALCVVVGLSSNGIYDIPTIKGWVDTWFNKKK
jgi:hypothetical protein